MKKALLVFIISVASMKGFSQTFPVPDHIVIAIFENHGYAQVHGSSAAPKINALCADANAALFTHSYGVEHPSQPNYLDLYSGCNQGVTDDNMPSSSFTTPNLGRQLLDAGKTFTTYSEDMPSAGYTGAAYGNYAHKHNPAANWIGTGTNQIPANTNQPFTAFPSDFTQLPTVSLVVPNQNDDMHNGTDPVSISTADTWFYNKLNSYVQWAKTHNSLLILTFDEDDDAHGNQILTVFCGQKVRAGQYTETINHYAVLRTIEDIYGLPHACNAATAQPITDIWSVSSATGISENAAAQNDFNIYPNPAHSDFTVLLVNPAMQAEKISVYDMAGKLVHEQVMTDKEEKVNCILSTGMYIVRVKAGEKYLTKKLSIEN